MTPEEYEYALKMAKEYTDPVTGCGKSTGVFAVSRALLHAHAKRRTPGTVEVCEYEAEHVDHGRCPYQPYEIAINHSLCAREDCPIHRSAT